MSAGKSPNNAFILHKERMKSVFVDICSGYKFKIDFYRTRRRNVKESELSKLYFYWETIPGLRTRQLYSKGYINTRGETLVRTAIHRRTRSNHSLVTLVREYYTDGVRAIGAME